MIKPIIDKSLLTRKNFIKIMGTASVAGFLSIWYALARRQEQLQPAEKVRIPDATLAGGINLFGEFYLVKQDNSVKAYSLHCAHAGCKVYALDDFTLSCPCHGSQYDAVSGRPLQGPAFKSLDELTCRFNKAKGEWEIDLKG